MEEYNIFLGTDISFDFKNMDINFSIGQGFEIVKGNNNLANAIAHRLFTNIGELSAHPAYGSNLNQILGKPQTEDTLGEAGLYVQEALFNEDRIQEINELEVFWEGKFLKINVIITPVNSPAPFSLILFYPTTDL